MTSGFAPMGMMIVGVKAAGHHFPSCRLIARCAATAKVLPPGRGRVRQRREIDDCFRTFGGRYRKKLGEPKEARDRAAALVRKACRDETGMQAICGDARAVQSASELTRKEDVAQFRATIGFHGPEIFRRLKIVEIQGGVLVRGGRPC